jgi:hypothetical protein
MIQIDRYCCFSKASGMLKKIKVFLSVLFITACSPIQTKDISLNGSWILTTTSGATYPVTIQQISPEQIIINADEIFLSGRYLLSKNRITSVDLNQPRIKNIELVRTDDGRYVITQPPLTARFGIQLKESFLSRSSNADK